MMPDINIIVCTPSGVPGHTYVAGVGATRCSSCGIEVAVSPSTMQIIEETPGDIWEFRCVRCALDALKSDPDPKIMPLTAGQIQEIEETLRGRS